MRMKRTVTLIVGVVLAACATVLAPRVSLAQESLARLVPQDAVFFKHSADIEKLWANVSASNFWKQLMSLKVWDDTGARAGIQEFAQEFLEEMGFELSTENIMSLFGKELALAVCVEPGEAPKIRAYLFCRGNPKSTAEKIVEKGWGNIKEELEEAESKESVHKGTKITSIKSAEAPVEVEFGFIDDVFAFAIGNTSPQLQKIVDLAGGTGTSLAENANFKKIVAATKMTAGRYAGCMYADLQKLGEILAAIDESQFPFPMQAMVGAMKQSLSMPIVVGGTGYLDRGLVMKTVSFPVGDVSNKLIDLSLKTIPAAGVNIKYIPENAIAYAAANNTPDWEVMWPLLLEQWEKQGAMPGMNMIFGHIETALGIKIADDVVPWLGKEFAVLLTDIDTKPGFPYPQFALMLKVKDKTKAGTFVDKLGSVIKEFSEEKGFKFEKSDYEGNLLNSVTIALPMPLPLTFTPSYGIVDDFVVISSSSELLKRMIDTSKGRGNNLAANAAFKALNIPAETTSTAFFNWGQFMEVVKAVGAWAVQFTQAQPVGESVKAAVENYVVPIANCLAALESIGGYQTNEGGMSMAIYTVRVKDLPAR